MERRKHCTAQTRRVWEFSPGKWRSRNLSKSLVDKRETRRLWGAPGVGGVFRNGRSIGIGSTSLLIVMVASLLQGCAFPAHVKEASKHQLEILNQADQVALNYQRTFATVIDMTAVHYGDGQAKAAALKQSEEVMMERQPVRILAEKVQKAMKEAKQKGEVIEGVKRLENMKARNTKNYEDYRRYLQVTKAVHSLLDSYISTDVAPESADIEALKSAVKELAQ